MTSTDQPTTPNKPTVSVGLPVYNGGSYLRAAIESVIDQKHDDWELIISDNASTDDTEAVCREFAARDDRIIYIRQAENLGAGPNFKACFEPARGEYFCWLSADDLLGPEFLSACAKVLDDQPDAVSAYTQAMRIDSAGNELGLYLSPDSVTARAADDTVTRYRELLVGYPAIIIFSLMRRDLLALTPVMSSSVGGDRILVSEMGLHGRFVQVDNVQFYRRVHEDQYSWKVTTPEARGVWFGGSKARGGAFTEFRRFGDHLDSIRRTPLDGKQRRQCRQALFLSFGPHMVKSQVGLTLRNIVARVANMTGRDIDLYRWMQNRQRSTS